MKRVAEIHPGDLYINWVLHAIYGKLAEADHIMRVGGKAIRWVADCLNDKQPIEPKPIYRGMLLDPSKPFKLEPSLTFMSWSEDQYVARWFASSYSYISKPLIAAKPELRGYLATAIIPSSRVLWHHSWTNLFGGDLASCALLHPMMGPEGARQIAWSLEVQREVITEPFELAPEPILGDVTLEVDRKLTPKWITDEEFAS